MLISHPHVHGTSIIKNDCPDGSKERVLVVQTKMWWASDYSVSNDTCALVELSEQLRRLETMARGADIGFDRIRIVPADLQ